MICKEFKLKQKLKKLDQNSVEWSKAFYELVDYYYSKGFAQSQL